METLWKVVKWSMEWPNSIHWDPIVMFCSRHPFFLWPYIWSHVEFLNTRWPCTLLKVPCYCAPTLSSNGLNDSIMETLHSTIFKSIEICTFTWKKKQVLFSTSHQLFWPVKRYQVECVQQWGFGPLLPSHNFMEF